MSLVGNPRELVQRQRSSHSNKFDSLSPLSNPIADVGGKGPIHPIF